MQEVEKKLNATIKAIGTGGLYLFSASVFSSRSGANIAIGAMALTFILSFHSWWPVLKRERLFQFSLCFFFLLALRTLWAAWEFPLLADRHLDGFWDWFYLSFTIPVAWWFHGKKDRVYPALYLAFGGLLGHILYSTDVTQFRQILRGARNGLGMQIPLTGLFSCTALLGVLLLGPRIWGSSKRRFLFSFRLIVWLSVTLAFLNALIITQSITSWVAGVIIFPPVLWIAFKRYFSPHGKKLLTVGTIVLIVGVAGIGLTLSTDFGTISKRLASQEKVFKALSSLDLDTIPFTGGIGVRLWTYRYGIEKWLERPLFGWGTGVEVTKLPERPRKCLDHLHNTYLEILNRFGLVGMLVFIAGAWLFLTSLKKTYMAQCIPSDLFLFSVGTLAIVVVWCMGNFRMPTYFRCYCILFGAMAYSFCIRLHEVNNAKPPPRMEGPAPANIGEDRLP